MGRDLEIQKLEKLVEKARSYDEAKPHLQKLKELDPHSKLWAAHKPGGHFYQKKYGKLSGGLKKVSVEHDVGWLNDEIPKKSSKKT